MFLKLVFGKRLEKFFSVVFNDIVINILKGCHILSENFYVNVNKPVKKTYFCKFCF